VPSDIGTKQNSPDALGLLRGVRQAYAKAKRLGTIQLALSSSAALASPVAAHFAPEALPFVALYGAAVLLVDLLFLEPEAKKHQEAGAQIQERFDARVLSFPWKVRHRPDPELRHALAKEYERSGDDDASLKNWYPSEVDALPTEQARLVCQRSNMKWDASLREDVWQHYRVALLALTLGAVSYAMLRHLSVDAAVVQVLVPVIPVGVRLARKLVEHRTASQDSDRAKRDVDRLWGRVCSGEFTPQELDDESRALQEDLFDRRRRSPQVPDFLYKRKRRDFEDQMAAAAKDMVDEALRAPPRSASA
jgi:hypothetical protein